MRPLILLTCLILLAAPVSWAEEPEPTTDLEKFGDTIRRVRNNISNAEAKVRNRVVGMSGDDVDPSKPGQVCCMQNIERIQRLVFSMGPFIRALEQCYISEQDVDSRIQLGLAREDAESLFRAVRNFRDADARAANMALAAMTKSFLLLNQNFGKLKECGAPTSPGESTP